MNQLIDLSELDLYERKQVERMVSKGVSIEEALAVLINTAEGDETQLSGELVRYGKERNLI